VRLRLSGGSLQGRSSASASQEVINLFQERGQDERSEPILVGIHGGTVFCTPEDGEVRGLYAHGSYLYAVVNGSFYRIQANGNAQKVAGIGSSSGPVKITDNGNQIIIADGGPLKVWDIATSTMTAASSPGTSVADFIDGYIVYINDGTGQFNYSELYDATDLPALNFSTAEGAPDDLVSLIVDRREIWLLGERTTEVWYNAGGVDNLFQRFQSGFQQMGCAAKHSVARLDNAVAWLGVNEYGSPVPVISRQYAPEHLTARDPQVAYQISTYSRVDDAIGYSYRFEGHEFYVLTFPSEGVTWCYDITEGEWHRRAHEIDDEFPSRERFNCHAYAFGKHFVGDFENGKIYQLSSRVYTLDGEIIPNVLTTQGMKDADEDRVHVRLVQLTGEEGVGGDVALSYSRDGGHTFTNERVASFGAVGNYKARAIWRKFSSGRDWVFRFIRRHDGKTVYTGLISKEHGE